MSSEPLIHAALPWLLVIAALTGFVWVIGWKVALIMAAVGLAIIFVVLVSTTIDSGWDEYQERRDREGDK